MEIKIGKKGIIKKGDDKGWYVLFYDDPKMKGLFVLTSDSCDMLSDNTFDCWVENYESLLKYVKDSNWEIEWIE
jgi:hypothetical protein